MRGMTKLRTLQKNWLFIVKVYAPSFVYQNIVNVRPGPTTFAVYHIIESKDPLRSF